MLTAREAAARTALAIAAAIPILSPAAALLLFPEDRAVIGASLWAPVAVSYLIVTVVPTPPGVRSVKEGLFNFLGLVAVIHAFARSGAPQWTPSEFAGNATYAAEAFFILFFSAASAIAFFRRLRGPSSDDVASALTYTGGRAP